MAVPTTMHIGRPCMQCIPIRVPVRRGARGKETRAFGGGGGGGMGRARGGGGGGRGTEASANAHPGTTHLGKGARKTTSTLRRCRHARALASGVLVLRVSGAVPGRATPHTTRRIPGGPRPAPRRPILPSYLLQLLPQAFLTPLSLYLLLFFLLLLLSPLLAFLFLACFQFLSPLHLLYLYWAKPGTTSRGVILYALDYWLPPTVA